MGRPKLADVAGHCYHMLNRANLRDTIFHKPEDVGILRKNPVPLAVPTLSHVTQLLMNTVFKISN